MEGVSRAPRTPEEREESHEEEQTPQQEPLFGTLPTLLPVYPSEPIEVVHPTALPHRTPPPARCHIGGAPLERRLPKPSTTAYQQWTPPPARRHSDGASPGATPPSRTDHYGHGIALTSCVTTSATAASEHPAHALGTQAPTAKATPVYPHRTPPPARCHTGGVPPERRLLNNRPLRRTNMDTTSGATPPPPLRRPRLARMERRLPKPSTYDEPHTDVNAGALPAKVACPRSGVSLRTTHHGPGIALPPSSPTTATAVPAPSQTLGAALTAYSQPERHLLNRPTGVPTWTPTPPSPPRRHGPASLLTTHAPASAAL
ncbi:hypothetical protein WOLCODRAFT_159067 [Wolfiporia cocos MD-104 SS10]|uniref:Uncharacterized protein n=1 Tax=Wolfiporia cocos (strain MD-104) TaxID=742152 RepID=A0A2H3JP39_WOLCO|nr:hypothetical protein WOLCODRAFT_159067 [Wolfiporia cocos MD-104 SS10]